MKDIREKIDNIDLQIMKFLDQRADFVKEIGRLKRERNEQVYVPHREKEIVERIRLQSDENEGSFPVGAKINVFREIIAASRSLQKELKISFLGPEATFTHLAATKQFSDICEYVSASSISQVFREVEKGRSDYGVVPIENSTEGIVSHTLDMFFDSDCKICSEILMEVSHSMLSREIEISKIKKIYSHPQAFAQCEMWLEENMPSVQCVAVSSTAKAASLAQKEKGSAAIASTMAAKIYNLNTIAHNIEDIRENITRFFIIGKKITSCSEDSKTTIMFSIKDRVGALHDMLVPFKKNAINLTKIESRPSRIKAWQYIFFIDIKGHMDNEDVRCALDELRANCMFLKILGSYPAATDIIKNQ